MRVLIRNTALLGSSYAVSILCGMASAKVLATTVGPKGYGLFGFYSSLLAILGLTASLGIPNALTRIGGELRAKGDMNGWQELRMAATLLLFGAAIVLGAGLTLFRIPLGLLIDGAPLSATTTLILGISLCFNLTVGLANSTIKTEGRVLSLARADTWMTVLVAATTITCVLLGHDNGVLAAVLLSAIGGWAVMRRYSSALPMSEVFRPAASRRIIAMMKRLSEFCLSYWGSSLTSAGFRMLIPFLVLRTLGTNSLGLFMTAFTIATIYLGPLVSVMGRDYFPRLVAVSAEDRKSIRSMVRDQQELILLIGLPSILLVFTLAPVVVPILYTQRFAAMVPLLQWMVLGDLFRYLAWSMGFVILAKLDAKTYFLIEACSGLGYALLAAVGLHLMGLQGLGVAYLVFQGGYMIVVWLVLHRRMGLGIDRELWPQMALSLLALTTAQLVNRGLSALPATWVLATVTASAVAYCITTLRGRWKGSARLSQSLQTER